MRSAGQFSLLLWCWTALGVAAQAQTIDYDLFDREGKRQGPKGWTVSVGAMGLSATPGAFDEAWVRAAIVNDETVADTVYAGRWNAQGATAFAMGVGRWKVRPTQGLIDRTGWLLALGTQSAQETFTGVIADTLGALHPDTVTLSGQTFNLRLQLHASRAFPVTRDLYIETRIGLGLHQDFDGTVRRAGDPDSLLVDLASLPATRLGIDVAAGLGVRRWSGRHLRLTIGTRALQLAPMSETGRAGSFDWMAGSYRPWHATLNLDLQQPRPATRCGEQTGGVHQPGRNLFGPTMRRRFHWSNP